MPCLPLFSFLSGLSVILLATRFFHFLLLSTKPESSKKKKFFRSLKRQAFRMKTTSPKITFMGIFCFDRNNLFCTLQFTTQLCTLCFHFEVVVFFFIKNVSRQQELAGEKVDKNVLCTWMLFYPVLRYCNKRRGLNHRAA